MFFFHAVCLAAQFSSIMKSASICFWQSARRAPPAAARREGGSESPALVCSPCEELKAEPSRAEPRRRVCLHLCDIHLTSSASTFPCDVRGRKSWRSRAETLREPRRPLNAEECSSVKLIEGHSWLMWWRECFCWCTMYRTEWALLSHSTAEGRLYCTSLCLYDCTDVRLPLLLLLQAGKHWFFFFFFFFFF